MLKLKILEIQEKIGVADTLLRHYIGIEAVEDIIADLEQALNKKVSEFMRNICLGVV